MNILPYIGIVLLVLLSSFFSASEIAYTSVNKVRLKKAAQGGDKKAKLAQKIADRYDAMLYTILIGNNLVNIGASALATVVAIQLMGDAGAGVASIVMTVLIVMFGEILPKTFGREQSDGFVKFAAYPLRFVMWLFRPLVGGLIWLVNKLSRAWRKDGEKLPTVTEEEFAAILETVEDEGVMDGERTELLQSALEFDERTAQEALTPRKSIYAIDVDDPEEEIFQTVLESRHSRIPVFEESIDNIIGVLYVNGYLKARARGDKLCLRELIHKPQFIHMTMKLDDALALLRKEHVQLAVVLDEYGGTQGILTMEDILEELVGDIWDESDDAVEAFVRVSENVYECEGSMALHDFFDCIDMDDEDFESEYTTVGGWATEMLDAMPEVGDFFQYKNLDVTVVAMDGPRVERVRVVVQPPPPEEEGED